MQTHVYANNQEIACKAAGNDGVSPQAFPDPCWSPPGPGAGPIVIPYPNTCFADSISNGTSTVFISGKEVAIEDQSFFATSTGNEAATNAFGKGVATGIITGKAYFAQWSFDVVFEGFGVPRHNDMVSHNHGSVPGNTPLFPYIARSIFPSPCNKEEARIIRECGPEKDESKAKKERNAKSKLHKLLKSKRSTTKGGGQRVNDWHWTDDHCDGLTVPLASAETAKKYAEDMNEVFKTLPDELAVLDAVKSELQSMVTNAAGKAAGKLALKAGIKQAAGSSVPVAGNIAMAIWSLYDAVVAIGDVKEIKRVATKALQELDILKTTLKELQTHAKTLDKLDPKVAHRIAVDAQEVLATLNDCTRARKCNLVPHTRSNGEPLLPNSMEHANKGGCCPGQTGHHLVPKESLDGKCKGYTHGLAPTVCVEGTSQFFGSHQRVHRALAKEHFNLARARKVASDGSMTLDDALAAAAQSHSEAFPLSNCDKDCIRAQLDAYYKETCGSIRTKMVDSSAKQTLPPEDDGPVD
ncbi:PAAR-like domain-containing protein [Massilia aquatica]|uniref:PAAR-like domain-containing protein n=1 Tax=Massilia aquatica TaxID=2609000 RepID=UPI001420BBB4|nr:PAAR-like domain-containing protein [Massilia aquatica]